MNAAAVRQRPTRRQLEALRTRFATGAIAAVAHEPDVVESAAHQHLSGSHRRTGCRNVAQAAYLLAKVEANAVAWRPPVGGKPRDLWNSVSKAFTTQTPAAARGIACA